MGHPFSPYQLFAVPAFKEFLSRRFARTCEKHEAVLCTTFQLKPAFPLSTLLCMVH